MEIGNSLESLKSLLGVSAPSPPATGARTAGVGVPGGGAAHADSLTLTSAASQVSQSADEDGVRPEKVAAVQAALGAGTYSVPAAAVASKLVDAMLGSAR